MISYDFGVSVYSAFKINYILFTVSVYDRKPEINEYSDATFTNVNRINNYDCSCQVSVNNAFSLP